MSKMVSVTLQLLVLLAFSFQSTLAATTETANVAQTTKINVQLAQGGVIPDVFISPVVTKLYVMYGKTEIEPGREVPVIEVKEEFTSVYVRIGDLKDKSDDSLYTLAMVDPDAPNGRQFVNDKYEFLHYLAINIPVEYTKMGPDTYASFAFEKGNVLAEYVSPAPKPKTGEHRYVFVLYKQEGRIDKSPRIEDRKRFNLSKWVGDQTHSIIAVPPFAATYFLAESNDN